METRDWFILFFTFIVGLLSGIYFYVTAYAPTYGDDTLTESELKAAEFSVIGVTYGGFTPQNYIHPSFRLSADRSYDYYAGGTIQVEKVEGELPKSLFNDIKDAISGSDLQALSEQVANKNCVSYADGIEYEYNIEIKGTEYELDTCLTAFNIETKLGRALMKVWGYADKPDEYEFSISNTPAGDNDIKDKGIPTLREYFEDGFKESGFE